jgi:ribosomal protein S18 acetylase RimI-like enzyme
VACSLDLVRLRTFTLDDYDAVRDLWSRAGPGIHLGRSDTREEIARKLAHDPDLAVAAELNGRIVGAVMGGYDGRRGIAYHLAVEPELRGHGLGRALMEELERRFRARGCLKYYLFVTPDNPEAVSFYEHLGAQVMPLTPMGKEL